MAEERLERRLAVILAADVVGYSRLMERDEAGTLSALKARRNNVLQPLIAKHHGRMAKVMGDGALIEFASAVDAVECAVQLQEAMETANEGMPEEQQIVLRIGINLGDVMVEGSDLYGDGVNIAARLEALAKPGGVLVSDTVVDHTRDKVNLGFEDLGEQILKNTAEPVRVYRVSRGAALPAWQPSSSGILPARLSIAVLPFVNMSDEPEQEYFSDGITEDIITDLSKVSAVSVLPRKSSFAFKGKAFDIGQMVRQLKVGYVVEGSVRRAGGRVRITAQLIDANKNAHVWAERYDRDLKDIFALQDEISQAIVAALKVKLLPDERKAIQSRSTEDPKAYQLYLLARYYVTQYGARNQEIAFRFCRRAVEIDPNYARAWALAAVCQAFMYTKGRSKESGLPAAEHALSLDPNLAEAHAAKGRALCQLGHYAEAIAAHEESLRLEPHSYDVQVNFALTCMYMGRFEAAIEHYERAAELLDTDYASLTMAAGCNRALGRHDESKSAARRALIRIEKEIALRADNAYALVLGAMSFAYLEEKERGLEWVSRALTLEPEDAQSYYNLACALAQLDEPDQALDHLENYARTMAPERINWIKRDPDFAPLHREPRFQALIAQCEARLAQIQAEQAAKPR